MTYCVAWKSLDTVFIISDTARTITDHSHEYVAAKKISSIGEVYYHDGNTTVEEWVHKQYKIADDFILTFAGDLTTAQEIIRTTKTCHDPSNPIKSFELALDSVRDPERPQNVSFLLGIRTNSKVSLFTYNYVGSRGKIVEIEENKLVQIGSMSDSEYNELAKRLYYEHIIDLKTPQEQFYQTIAFFQHFGLHANTFLHKAGGVYTGILLNQMGASWSDDTTVIVYDRHVESEDKIELLGGVNYLIRRDVFSISSTFTNQIEVYIDDENNPLYSSDTLQQFIQEEHHSFNPQVVIFLAKDERTIAVIKTNGWGNTNNYFSLQNNDSKQELYFYEEFNQILKFKPINKNNFAFIFWQEVYRTDPQLTANNDKKQ